MPMIMDQDLDDLFGDSVTLNLPSEPPGPGLRQRVDDLHVRGSSQYVTISTDVLGQSLNI